MLLKSTLAAGLYCYLRRVARGAMDRGEGGCAEDAKQLGLPQTEVPFLRRALAFVKLLLSNPAAMLIAARLSKGAATVPSYVYINSRDIITHFNKQIFAALEKRSISPDSVFA